MSIIKKILGGLLLVIATVWMWALFQTPSLDRDWSDDVKILPEISFQEGSVKIQNIRDFDYDSAHSYEARYYDEIFNFDEIESVYYIIEPFGDYVGPAHTMLSFGFKNGEYIVVSAEIRKEIGESFSPILGALNRYEMVYIIGSERDLIKLRANHRNDDVFMYPIATSQENMQKMFRGVLHRADDLSHTPQFYNTFSNTCVTSILQHVNTLRQDSGKDLISWSKQIFLPSHSDEIAYELGLIDTNLSLQEAREYYKINELSEKYADDENYSRLIRKERR